MGGSNFWRIMANFSVGCSFRFRSRLWFTQGHTAFDQHWRNWCGDLELLHGLASLSWRWPRSRGREISTEDHLWNSLWYPTLSRLVISTNIQVIFGIVVNDVFIIEKCSLKCKCLIWDQNHVWTQIKTHKIFIWAFIGYQASCMWPKYAWFIGCCPHEWLMSLKTTFENEVIYYQQITSNACQQSGRRLKKKKALKKGFLHYNTKIIITESNSQILGELLLLQTERN